MGREFGVQGSATMIVWPMVPCCLWSNVDIQLQTGLTGLLKLVQVKGILTDGNQVQGIIIW